MTRKRYITDKSNNGVDRNWIKNHKDYPAYSNLRDETIHQNPSFKEHIDIGSHYKEEGWLYVVLHPNFCTGKKRIKIDFFQSSSDSLFYIYFKRNSNKYFNSKYIPQNILAVLQKTFATSMDSIPYGSKTKGLKLLSSESQEKAISKFKEIAFSLQELDFHK